MGTKKKFSKDKIVVVGISIAAIFLMGAFILKNSGPPAASINADSDSVVVSKTGEASSINFTVPSTNVKNEEGGILDEYAKADAEAQREEKEKKGNILMPDMSSDSGATNNDKLYSGQDDEFMQNVQRQLEEMEEEGSTGGTMKFDGVPQSSQNVGSAVMDDKTKLQQEMEYRQMLLDARELQNQRSQDFSAGGTVTDDRGQNSTSDDKNGAAGVEIKASIYKHQLIVPGERVTMILPEELTYMGSTFPKNTLLFGMATIKENRVILEVANINHVRVGLQAYDVDDGMRGLYNEQAGALWKKYEGEIEAEIGGDVIEDAARAVPGGIGRMVSPLTRAFGSFFRKKNISNREKILLVDDDQVILKMPDDE